MAYIHGTFRDIRNTPIEVHILTNGDKTKEVIIGEDGLFFGGDTPIEITEDNDDLFTPIIKKSCTINLVTDKYIGDTLYAENSRNAKVLIKKGDKVIFSGYVEPNTYQQPYVDVLDSFTLNCTDALSTLQYFQYNDVTPKNFDEKRSDATTVSFKGMLDKVFDDGMLSIDFLSNTKGKIYYDLSKGIYVNDQTTITRELFDKLTMSEVYLIGDEFDDTWTYDDVLTEILKYLNLHVRQEGLDYYIFDWDSVRNKVTTWYDINAKKDVTLPQSTVTLTDQSFSSADANITVDDVYNQIQVTDQLKSSDTLITSPLDGKKLTSIFSGKVKYMTEYISEGEGDRAITAFNHIVRGEKSDYNNYKIIDWYMQCMSNKNWKFRDWNGNMTEAQSGNTQYEVPKNVMHNPLSCGIFKFGSVDMDVNKKDNSPINKLTMTPYMYISVNGNEQNKLLEVWPSSSALEKAQPLVEYIGNESGAVLSPPDSKTTNYIVFSGKMFLQPIVKESYSNSGVIKPIDGDAEANYDAIRNDGVWEGSTVPSANHADGRYYTRKFYINDKGDWLKNHTCSLQPLTADKSRKEFKFNYSAMWNSDDLISKVPILECELIIGNKRLVEYDIKADGEGSFKWVDVNSGVEQTTVDDNGNNYTYLKKTFSLGFNPKIEDYIIGQEYDIQNNINYTMNLDKSGTAIPIKSTDKLSGAVIFRILGACNNIWNDITRRHPDFFHHTKWTENSRFLLAYTQNIIMQDFKCEICTDNGGYTLYEDKDLIYVSDETDRFIKKYDNIKFNFITQPTSEEAFKKGLKNAIYVNAVGVDSDTLVDSLQVRELVDLVTKDKAYAEQLYIDQYYRFYSNPKLKFEVDIRDDQTLPFNTIFYSKTLNKTFFIESATRDLQNNSHSLTLREL